MGEVASKTICSGSYPWPQVPGHQGGNSNHWYCWGQVFALIDCGATSQFMDCDYVEKNRLTTQKLWCAIPVFNADGSPNEVGSITEIIDMILCYKRHMERTSFAVTSLWKQDIILGFTWLQEHNPEINWRTQEVAMSQCPARCHLCQSDTRKECQECQRVEWLIWMCCSGPHPLLLEEESEADSTPDPNMIPNSTSAPASELHSTLESESILLLWYICILFDVKILNIFVYVKSGAGCMHVYVDGVLAFVCAGCD